MVKARSITVSGEPELLTTYTAKTWRNGDDWEESFRTPIDADSLNRIENQLATTTSKINDIISNSIPNAVSNLEGKITTDVTTGNIPAHSYKTTEGSENIEARIKKIYGLTTIPETSDTHSLNSCINALESYKTVVSTSFNTTNSKVSEIEGVANAASQNATESKNIANQLQTDITRLDGQLKAAWTPNIYTATDGYYISGVTVAKNEGSEEDGEHTYTEPIFEYSANPLLIELDEETLMNGDTIVRSLQTYNKSIGQNASNIKDIPYIAYLESRIAALEAQLGITTPPYGEVE